MGSGSTLLHVETQKCCGISLQEKILSNVWLQGISLEIANNNEVLSSFVYNFLRLLVKETEADNTKQEIRTVCSAFKGFLKELPDELCSSLSTPVNSAYGIHPATSVSRECVEFAINVQFQKHKHYCKSWR